MPNPGEVARKTYRIPLATKLESRTGFPPYLDGRIINGYIDVSPNGSTRVVKRPGTTPPIMSLSPASSNTLVTGLGIYNWNGVIYTIFLNQNTGVTTFYKNGSSIGTSGSSVGVVYSFNVQIAGTNKLFFHDASNGTRTSNGYVYDPVGGLVAITDTNFVAFSANLCTGSAYLDGTMYVLDNTGTVWGSALGDATTWPALNFIKAQVESDAGVAISKQNAFVVVLKQWSTEFFYDNANPTGSPLNAYTEAKLDVGCADAGSLQSFSALPSGTGTGGLIFISRARIAGIGVHLISNLQAKKISTPHIDTILQNAVVSNVPGATSTVYSSQVSSNGHIFYVLTLNYISNAIGNYATFNLVYDLTTDEWFEWKGVQGNAQELYWADSTIATPANGLIYSYVQDAASGSVYQMEPTVYTDTFAFSGPNVTYPVTVDIYTQNFDGGTRQRKYVSRLTVIGDQYQGSTAQIRHSDDDYKTWSNWRTVDLGKKQPVLHTDGTFIKRAYQVRHTANTPLRLEALELDILLGDYNG